MPNYVADTDLKIFYAQMTLKWCKKNLGVSNTKRRNLNFNISFRKRHIGKYIAYGMYCFYRNKITLYIENCNTLNYVVATIIHEYTHYLQSRTQYKKYDEIYYYSTNPYERQAKRNEKLYTKECMKYVRYQSTISA